MAGGSGVCRTEVAVGSGIFDDGTGVGSFGVDVSGSGVGVTIGASDTGAVALPPHPTRNHRSNITALINFNEFDQFIVFTSFSLLAG